MSVARGERQVFILDRLATEGTLSVAQLAQDLNVSEVTIRSTLKNMEAQGLLSRTRGGAKSTNYTTIDQRTRLNIAEKKAIAAAAASKVHDGDRIMIEAGTTTALIVRYLAGRKGVQIVTNSTLVFSNARRLPGLEVILTGGVFRRENESIVGPLAVRNVNEFNARLTFLGTDGLSIERGLTTQFIEGGEVARAMVHRSEEAWLVTDSSKYGRVGFVSFLGVDEVSGIITDAGLPKEAQTKLAKKNIDIRLV